MNIVLCGDSYFDKDGRYPGLHWADRLSPHTVYNLARGGASNFSISLQIYQSALLKPDLVLISFTSQPRIEFAQNTSKLSFTLDSDLQTRYWQLRNNIFDAYDHALLGHNADKFVKWMPWYVPSLDQLKNYFYIKSALAYLDANNINYYYSLGGFTSATVAGIDMDFTPYQHKNLLPNSWQHSEKLNDPYFHIADPVWHEQFSQTVLELING